MKFSDYKAQKDALEAEGTVAWRAKYEAVDAKQQALYLESARNYTRDDGVESLAVGVYGDHHRVTWEPRHSIEVPITRLSSEQLRWIADVVDMYEAWKRGELAELPPSGVHVEGWEICEICDLFIPHDAPEGSWMTDPEDPIVYHTACAVAAGPEEVAAAAIAASRAFDPTEGGKYIACRACSVAGGAERAVYHTPPECPEEP